MDFTRSFFCNILIAVIGFAVTNYLVPKYSGAFLSAHFEGVDLNRQGSRILPEGVGIVTIAIYIVCMIFFALIVHINETAIFTFLESLFSGGILFDDTPISPSLRFFDFNQKDFVRYLGVLLAICIMGLVASIDDVLRIKRRYRFILPAIASLPLLVMYYSTIGNTYVEVPWIFWYRWEPYVRLGIFYYLYLMLFVIFCANSVSLMSSINGSEVGQVVIICSSIIFLNCMEVFRPGPCASHHKFCLFFMIPFLGISLALLKYDWYPARLFVGDAFCNVVGIIFASMAVLGHFSPILLTILAPQVFNFIYSLPQLLSVLPSREHRRLSTFDQATGMINMSMVSMKVENASKIPRILRFLDYWNLALVKRNETGDSVTFNNLTLSNYILKVNGPMEERHLAIAMLLIQCVFSVLALFLHFVLNIYPCFFCGIPWKPTAP